MVDRAKTSRAKQRLSKASVTTRKHPKKVSPDSDVTTSRSIHRYTSYSDDEAAKRASRSESHGANYPGRKTSSRHDIADARALYAELTASGVTTPLKETADELRIPRSTVRRWHLEGRLGDLSDEQLQAVADAWTTHDDEKRAAKAVGISVSAFQYQLRQAAHRGMLGTKPVLPGFKIAKTTAFQDADGTITREVITQKPDVQLADFSKIPENHRLERSTIQVAGGKIEREWYKTKEGIRPAEQVADWLKNAFRAFEGRALPTPSIIAPKRHLVNLLPCNDWHVGMFSWARETGTNWDLRIAEDAIGQGVVDTIDRLPKAPTTIVLGGGDLVHADNNNNRTERSGNKLDVDGRHQKVVETAGRLMVLGIDTALQRSEHVIVRILKGNHDEETSSSIAWFLFAWYRNEPRVTVDCDQSLFWFWRQEYLFLAATHGHEAKLQDMPGIMAHRRAQDWGASRHRYAHGFHIHHSSKFATESHGVLMESHQAPIPQDAWHYGAGFLSGRSLQGITYDDRFGEVSRVRVAMMDAEEERMAA